MNLDIAISYALPVAVTMLALIIYSDWTNHNGE
jgi:hypothetical protein